MKDDFINLETEKVRKENTNGSKATSVLIDDFINEYDVIGSVLRKNRTKISKAINLQKFSLTEDQFILLVQEQAAD